MARHMRPRPPRRSRLPLFIAGAVLVGGIGLASVPPAIPTHSSVQTASPIVTALPSVSPTPTLVSATPTATKQSIAAPKTPAPSKKSFSVIGEVQELEIPSAGFHYRVEALPAESILANAVIDPPLNPSVVYVVGALRKKDSQIDITGHSSSDGSNWPLNVISDASLVKLGDPVLLTSTTGKHAYVVSEIASLVRADVAASKYQDPDREDRITFFTCDVHDLYQRTRILVATRVS